jgi:hypothetical protein
MQKIPFAIESCSGELVEVGQVKSGRNCGCICPSCGQSVVARQGAINQWHFAHDSKGMVPPHSLCEISFYVCCKRFVIEQLIKSEALTLTTPGYSVSEKQLVSTGGLLKSISASSVVTEARTLTINRFGRDGRFDVAASIGAHIIDIILDYPERSPAYNFADANAVLVVDLKFIADRYEGVRAAPALIQQAVIDLISSDVKHKRWIFHPREISVRARLHEKLNEKLKQAQSLGKQSGISPTPKSQTAICKMCNEEWYWTGGEPLVCKTCNTHLFIALITTS